MRLRPVIAALVLASVLSGAACSTSDPDSAGQSSSASARVPDGGTSLSASPEASRQDGAVPQDTSRKSGAGHGMPQSTTGPVLERAEVSTHDSYDRISFHFSGGTPEFFAEYVDVLRHGGLGKEVRIAGDHRLKIVFVAVGDGSSVGEADTTSTIREVRDLSVFEGELGIGVGIDSGDGGRPGFRVSADDKTVVVDIARS